jgi:hypothetical protein
MNALLLVVFVGMLALRKIQMDMMISGVLERPAL